MAYSYQQVTGDGSTVQIPLTIGFLDRADISVTVNNVLNTTWTWLSPSINTIVLTAAPGVGVPVLIQRKTKLNAIRHTYSLGALFSTETLDANFKQLLYLAQEAYESALAGGGAVLDAAKAYTDSAVYNLRTYVDSTALNLRNYIDSKVYAADSIAANDGAGGSKFTTVAGFISRAMASTGASLIGFVQLGTGAVLRYVQDELRDWVKVTQFGASPSASAATNDAAFVAATAYAVANGLGLVIPRGSYTLGSTWTLSTGGLRVRAEGKVVLNFTNAGNCVVVDGSSAPGTYIFDIHFGSLFNPIWINGNASTTTALLWRAAHHGSAAIKAWNCVIGHRTQFAVGNNFWITVSNSEAVSNVLVPTTGISCERRGAGEDTAANMWWSPVLEGILTSTGHGIYLGYTNRNKFKGGTSEGNKVGVFATTTAVGDTVDGLYCEVNSGSAHFDISGTLITLRDCDSTTSLPAPTDWVKVRGTAKDCRIIGGNHPSITIDTGALRTQVIGNAHDAAATVVDNGTDTTIIQGSAAWKLPFGAYIGGGSAPLSYYGEGVLTATITCAGGTVTLDPTFSTLQWVRVGKLTTVTGLLIVSSVSSPSGLCAVGNLPVSAGAGTAARAGVAIRAASLAAGATTAVQGRIISSDNKIYLETYSAGVASNLSAHIQAGTELYISATYISA